MEQCLLKSLVLRNHKKRKVKEQDGWSKGEICAWRCWKTKLSCKGAWRKQCWNAEWASSYEAKVFWTDRLEFTTESFVFANRGDLHVARMGLFWSSWDMLCPKIPPCFPHPHPHLSPLHRREFPSSFSLSTVVTFVSGHQRFKRQHD